MSKPGRPRRGLCHCPIYNDPRRYTKTVAGKDLSMEAILRYGSAGGLIATLVAIVLSSCSAAPIAVEPTPTVHPSTTIVPTTVAAAVISEQAAIAAALKYATLGDGHISSAQEPPRNIHAELLPLDQARDQLIAYGWSSNSAESSNVAIWLITLDGTWTVNGPPQLPGITPSPLAPLHQLVVALDAGTGAVRFISGRP